MLPHGSLDGVRVTTVCDETDDALVVIDLLLSLLRVVDEDGAVLRHVEPGPGGGEQIAEVVVGAPRGQRCVHVLVRALYLLRTRIADQLSHPRIGVASLTPVVGSDDGPRQAGDDTVQCGDRLERLRP